MVDIGWNNRSFLGDFGVHELGGDFFWDVGAEVVVGVLLIE